MKYDQPKEGEWVQPISKGYKFNCCDCGLVHNIDFRLKAGHIQFRVWRNNRSTGQVRRHRSINVTHIYEPE
jgi:hypothetical protein